MQITKDSALLVIDIQEPDPNSPIPFMKDDAFYDHSISVIQRFREMKLPVIQVHEVHRDDHCDFGRELDGQEGVHNLESWPSAQFHHLTKPEGNDYQFIKRRYSAFLGTDLDILLDCLKVKNLYLIGALTDVCVRCTATDAVQNGYQIHVIRDSVTGSSPKAHEYALEFINRLSPGCELTTDEFLRMEAAV